FVLQQFIKYATVPVINLESAIRHPLQSFTDLMTIRQFQQKAKPKIVLTWAPHPKALPQAVANSFLEWMYAANEEVTITHPKGFELAPEFCFDFPIEYDQERALAEADFVYVKNWSSYKDYGKVLNQDSNWMITKAKLGNAKFMHCLPVRRNVVVEDAVLDSEQSVVIEQANNRTFSAQVVLKKLLENL
ncbi:MAG: acetylornithine carbamoyltransferase, partial [Bacteroidota bacterium]